MTQHRKTRRQKQQQNPAGPSGQSRYALKLHRRRRLAASMGVQDAPLPVLLMSNEQRETIAYHVAQRDRLFPRGREVSTLSED